MNYTSQDLTDTIVALATPAGEGALGVIRLSGPDAITMAAKAFHGKDLNTQASHTIHFGRIENEEGRTLDEVLASVFVAPHSYTGENVVEVSCHGSSYIIQEIIQLFIRHGARLAQPGEYTLRAFLNGRMDLSQAEAVADLIAAESRSQHELAMRQMRGGFSGQIKHLRQQLIDFASLIELELDFSEEDVEFANREKLRTLVDEIQELIRSLLQSFQLGNVIRKGVSTVIAGRPNAGKSTLLNALLNEERAIVSEIAGTTRDTIEELININGIPFRLIDTAGLRDAQDTIEAVGVQRTLEKIKSSAILVYVFDIDALTPTQVAEDLEELERADLPTLVVANKMDHTHKNPDLYHGIHSAPIHFIAARERRGIENVKRELYNLVLAQNINLDNPIITNARHYEALRQAGISLDRVLAGLDENITSDFIAMDIRQAVHHLGEITGEISTEDLLGNIFSKFCIGK